VNATVQNLGFNDQDDVLVNCSVFEGGLGGTVLFEDFSSDPSDWSITTTGGSEAWEWDSVDKRMEHSYEYGEIVTGYLDSPVLDCSGKSGMSLSFWHDWKADWSGGLQDGWVRGSVDGGVSFPYLIDEFHHDDPGEDEGVKSYDVSWADNQDSVVIRFEVFNDNDWHWYVDDVNLSADIAGPLVYSSEEVVDVDAYESCFVDFSPVWTATDGVYGVQVKTLLSGDEFSGNDLVGETVFVEGPELSFSPSGFDAGMVLVNASVNSSFDVWNGNVGTLSYSLSESCDWLSLSSLGGSVSVGEVDSVDVVVDTSGLVPGLYACDVGISSDGGDGVFGVSVMVVDNTTELLDVNQSLFDRGFRLMPGWDAAQEFVPGYASLSSVELFLAKAGVYDGSVTVQILEDNVLGDVVFEDTLDASAVPGAYSWVSVDVGVAVDVGETYVVVLKDASGASAYDNLLWGWCDSFASGSGGPFDGGWFWFRKDGNVNWLSQRDWDYTFKTFGYD